MIYVVYHLVLQTAILETSNRQYWLSWLVIKRIVATQVRMSTWSLGPTNMVPSSLLCICTRIKTPVPRFEHLFSDLKAKASIMRAMALLNTRVL